MKRICASNWAITKNHCMMHGQQNVKIIRSIFINLYMFRTTICPSSGETSVFMRHLVLVILKQVDSLKLQTIHLFQNNKYQVSHKHSCFSWWWAYSRPRHVEIDKYTGINFYTKLALFAWLYRDAGQQNIKHKITADRHQLHKFIFFSQQEEKNF